MHVQYKLHMYVSYSETHRFPLFQCLVPPQSAVRSGECQTEGGSPVEGEGREEWSGEEARSLSIGQEWPSTYVVLMGQMNQRSIRTYSH